MSGMIRRCCLVLIIGSAQPANFVEADIIPPGNKKVSHHMVFADSPLLQSHRLIAMPVRGFGGFTEVQAGQPFQFSSKYGTRLYVVPSDYHPPGKVFHGEPLPFPSCEVPVSSTTSVPKFSPVASLRTTCKLIAVGDDSIGVEVIEHVELGSGNQPVTPWQRMLPFVAIAATGLLGCILVWRWNRARMAGAEDSVCSVQ